MSQYQDFQHGGVVPQFSRLGRISRKSHVTKSLNTTRALADPGYTLAVLHYYAQSKMSRGHSKLGLHQKLEALELRMPHFANDFRTVRTQLELLPSRVLPNGELGPPPPPYVNTKNSCSCSCTCGARELDAAASESLSMSMSDIALDSLPMREMAGPYSRGSSPQSSYTSAFSSPSHSTSASVSSMSLLAQSQSSDVLASMSTPAFSLVPGVAPGSHAPSGPRGLGISLRSRPRFRTTSNASMF